MSKFKKGDKVIINRYGKPSVKGTIDSVPDGVRERIFYKVRLEDGNYLKSPESDMISAEIEIYFYCPVCGRKTLIKDAVIRKYLQNKSFRLDNAAMPGWMKISASADYCYIRVCPQCEMATISNETLVRACSGNALEYRKGKIRAVENSGCMLLVGSIITVLSAACWILFLII